ncbi:MAG: DUF349 domain-containing protein [Porphyromonadaceae bacterium]|nr:DUF349 domain-containing protein [Porphyromonadaceae bacterium]
MSNLENQDNILNNPIENSAENMTEITTNVPNADQVASPLNEEAVSHEKSYINHTREELVKELSDMINNAKDNVVGEIKHSVEAIKQAFYKQQKEKDSLLSQGSEVVEKVVDSVEEAFKELLGKYKDMKASANALLAEEKEKNLKLKEDILTKLEELTNSTDDLSTTIPAFRKLQQEWKNIGQIPQSAVTEIWKTYNKYQEKFYDLIKINNELREYDFKKNLELKTALCATAEKLEDEPNAVLAFNTLQKLHEEWREIGPVAKEERETIWNRFKEASTKINKKHQAYFESLKEQEEENLKLKTALCEKVEAIDLEKLKTRKQWQDKIEEILAIQEEWKKIGFATKKANNKIFKRFREACDRFFKAKNSFYKGIKEEMAENLAKRKVLLEKAEALKATENWKEASETVKELQKEWRKIGATVKKHSDEIWEKFSAVCDYIFDQKNQISSEARAVEEDNLKQKRALVEKVNEFVPTGDRNNDVAALKEIMAEFDKIGFVPIKEKASINSEFKKAVDSKFDIVFDRKTRKEDNKVLDEASNKYLKEYNALKKEIAAYENNILFLTSSSKKGNSLVDEMNKKIEELKAKLSQLSDKL